MDGTASADSRAHRGPARAPSPRATRRTVAYCSANDRNVPVLVPASADARAYRKVSHRDAGCLVCLDFGVRCTGALCPLFQVPTPVEEPRPRPDGSGSH